ncbi:hypothetical protein [Paracoccus benzoatiresistens]|uniref:DUF2946 domain-containing protein n=1 Tax=Paracoccus benzoatiresistens TaxID=2997341 RepID=A0ABT4IZ09_9RHOB|nr:hypothetical protein [Paracoccus sp. EF6]MCZ0960100.1 hypothetical protein [Paracoccus sp. EF6]
MRQLDPCAERAGSGIATVMRRKRSPRILGLAFLALTVLALATGLSASPVPTEMDLRLQAWVLSGVSLDDILCEDHGAGHLGHGDGHCPLCNLTAPPGLPAVAPSLTDADQRILARIVLPQIRRAEGRARDPALPKRGPPALT